MSDFTFSFSPDSSLSASDQGQFASAYTNQLKAFLQSDAGADYVAYLAHSVNGLEVADALALVELIQAGDFALDGLFNAAQSKTGTIDGVAGSPSPIITIGEVVVDLTAILSGEDTFNWTTVTKKDTIYHAREYYADGGAPEGWTAGWADPAPELQKYTFSESYTVTNPNGNDTVPLNVDLLGQDWSNFQIEVTGVGDYDRTNEGYTVAGDATASFNGPATTGNTNTLTYVGDATNEEFGADTNNDGVPDGLEDGSFDVTVAWAEATAAGSTVTITLTYDYWA
ncbi:hypothetical protein [Hydrogenophaga aquatica]